MDALPTRDDPRGRRRNRYQHAVAALTGLATAGSLTATGRIAGQAAHTWQTAHQTTTGPGGSSSTGNRHRSTPASATRGDDREGERPRIVLRERPTRTRTSTRYVAPAAPVGGGGTVSSTPTHVTQGAPPAPSSGS
jgi:hypothetical protein